MHAFARYTHRRVFLFFFSFSVHLTHITSTMSTTLTIHLALCRGLLLLNNSIAMILIRRRARLLHRLEVRRKSTLHAKSFPEEIEDHRDGHENRGNTAKKRTGPLNAHALEHLARE